jgi:hypothetical protein
MHVWSMKLEFIDHVEQRDNEDNVVEPHIVDAIACCLAVNVCWSI